jgi:hypothetical protein
VLISVELVVENYVLTNKTLTLERF